MLRSLTVENYALIDRLDVRFDDRLNIITGETGAGKSILMAFTEISTGEVTPESLYSTLTSVDHGHC